MTNQKTKTKKSNLNKYAASLPQKKMYTCD